MTIPSSIHPGHRSSNNDSTVRVNYTMICKWQLREAYLLDHNTCVLKMEFSMNAIMVNSRIYFKENSSLKSYLLRLKVMNSRRCSSIKPIDFTRPGGLAGVHAFGKVYMKSIHRNPRTTNCKIHSDVRSAQRGLHAWT
jgi:hypothetical protein